MLVRIAQSLGAGLTADAETQAHAYAASRPDTAVAWADVAWLASQAGQTEIARRWLDTAAALDPGRREPQVLDGLCRLAVRSGDMDAAARWGRLALQRKHERAMAGDWPWTAPVHDPATARQPLRNLISFSLFGPDAWYGESAVATLERTRGLYPGWQAVVYVDDAVSTPLRQRLQAAGAQVRLPPEPWRTWPGTVWRFAAIEDPQAAYVLLRDVDSPPTPREAAAVAEWMAGEKIAHVMRDHPQHCDLMLAGLWGCEASALKGIGEMLARWLHPSHAPRHPTHADQHFLRDCVWPRIASGVLQHDSCFDWNGAQPFPQTEGQDSNVGHAPGVETAIALRGTPVKNGTVFWDLVDGNSAAVLAHYASPLRDGQWRIKLPPAAAQQLHEGRVKAQPTSAQ